MAFTDDQNLECWRHAQLGMRADGLRDFPFFKDQRIAAFDAIKGVMDSPQFRAAMVSAIDAQGPEMADLTGGRKKMLFESTMKVMVERGLFG